ncbi:hypothetical protein EW146_g9913 [Bondarzewia mesenterica]|uniref:Ferritin-like diiron domain-containing protein n=1 Tax=Bondarzewia mesenterica TaxID=1095465 RepID=A0A4V3XCD5_9AGAM|nr:hypothetical protein EW146_g9913 [Bondarzewia mesenterica]
MMFIASLVPLAIFATSVSARPLRRASSDEPTDTQILNFALTLEHIENAFYSEGMSKYSAQDFENAGLPSFAYGRFKEIAEHEANHVAFLTSALGQDATQPCSYSFPYDDPKSFVAVSYALESVGDSAYVGASKFIHNKDYLLAAATILSTEARHSAWINSAVREGNPWSGPYETPLDLNQVYTIASSFITDCPSTNPTLPVKAFPALTAAAATKAAPGQSLKLDFTWPSDQSAKLYGAFLSGQDALIVPLSDDGSVFIPDTLRGTTYLIVTTDADGVSDDTTVAGPLMLQLSYDSYGNPEMLQF